MLAGICGIASSGMKGHLLGRKRALQVVANDVERRHGPHALPLWWQRPCSSSALSRLSSPFLLPWWPWADVTEENKVPHTSSNQARSWPIWGSRL